MQTFEQIRSQLAAGDFRITMQEPYVICVELSLDNGRRHQAIFLSELQDDDGRNFLRVSTVIAPVTGIDARRALAFNWNSHVGYLALGELDGVPYLQLCENRPYDGLSAAEVDRLVLEIGGMGDNLERALSADGDLL
jgi:HAMP domain-containing protein